MKVVLVSLARRGGMVHFLVELANALAPLGQTVVVVSAAAALQGLSRKPARIALDTGAGSLHRLAQSLNPVLWCGLLRRLTALQPDVIHIVGVHQWNPLIGLLSKLLGRPLVYTVHDPEPHPGAPWTIRMGDWLTTRMANTIIVLTDHGRRQLRTRGFPEAGIRVIPHPMYSFFRRWRPRNSRPARVMLYFGRIEAYKGVEQLVQAYTSAHKSLSGWRLVIAGEGRLPASLTGAELDDIQIINRYLSEREVAGLMQAASFVVLPYTSATQSGVVALAQAFGRPVIVSDVGGLREMVKDGETGMLVPPDNVVALSRAMRSLAGNHRRLVRMQRAAAEDAENRWSSRAIARAHLELYASIRGAPGK